MAWLCDEKWAESKQEGGWRFGVFGSRYRILLAAFEFEDQQYFNSKKTEYKKGITIESALLFSKLILALWSKYAI